MSEASIKSVPNGFSLSLEDTSRLDYKRETKSVSVKWLAKYGNIFGIQNLLIATIHSNLPDS